MKKLTILVLVVSFIALLYGCGSSSSNSVFVKPNGDISISQRNVVVDDNGKFSTVTFPSGVSLVCSEENTIKPGMKLTLTEQRTTPQNISYFSEASNSKVYMYEIVSDQDSSNSAVSKENATTLEKPITINLPPNTDNSVYYLGTRESDTDPWRFSRVGAQSGNAANNDNSFNLHNLGTSFCIVTYNESTENKLPATVVDSMVATSSNSIQIKDGKYMEDLQVIGKIEGINLNNINSSDFRARITYRSNNSNAAPLKVNGVNVSQSTNADNTVPGYTYKHSFEVSSFDELNLMNTSGDFAFTLNLEGIDIKSFPTGFLVEFYNRVNGENVLPYSFSGLFNVNCEENDEVVVVNVSIEADNNTIDETSGLYELNPVFNITIDTELSNSDKKKIESALSVTNIESEKITKTWNGNNLTISFNEELEPDTTYTLSFAEITDINGISFAQVSDFTFKTKPQIIGSFAIIYNINGGTFAEGLSNPEHYGIASETFLLVNPTKEGYVFAGWTGSNGDTPQINVVINKGSTGDKSFIANWAVNSYKVTLKKGTGVDEVVGDGTYEYGANVIATCTFLEGYEFDFWTGNNTQSEFTMPANDVVMQANAKLTKYFIYCDLKGGEPIAPNQISYNINSDDIPLINPTKNGYTFDGWSGTDLVGNDNLDVTISHGSTGDREYTANYTLLHYTIDYDLASGSLEVGVSNPISYDVTSATIILNKPIRHNYDFTGWTGTGIDGIASDVTIVQGSYDNRKYVASWTMKDVLTFNLPNDVTIDVKRCPAGTFLMGSPDGELGSQSYEQPQISVTISKDFYIGIYEVTQDQYFAVMGTNPSEFREGADEDTRPTTSANYPAEKMTWFDAKAFCNWMNENIASDSLPKGYYFDLPTEAQWEYACRAGTTTSLNNGENISTLDEPCPIVDTLAWFSVNSNNTTHTVGQKLPNAWGLYDMHGNVLEWCRDSTQSNYSNLGNNCIDPLYVNQGSGVMVRGGCWNQYSNYSRSAHRQGWGNTAASNMVGIRLALVKN